jgi:predicted MPP superfamily phosphohydrolase
VSAGTLALALFILVALLALLLMLREAASFALETVRLPADGGASDACAGATPDGNSLGDSGANAQVAAGAEPTAPGAGSYASAMPATASATAGDTGAAPASDSGGLRILHLSDIHLRLLPIPLPKIADAVRRAAPDIVVLTGDYLTSPKDAAPFLDWLSAIIAASGGAAFFLCFGNHDIKAFGYNAFELAAYEKQLKKLGVAVLENRTAIVERGGRAYSITGLRDFSRKPVRAEPALRAAPKAGCYRIGITHNPDIALDLPPRSLDLLLCGHFHGGQIWLPLNLQYTCLRKERLCRMGICSGLHELNGIKLYISRGLGCVLFPLRFRAKPEMTLIIAP